MEKRFKIKKAGTKKVIDIELKSFNDGKRIGLFINNGPIICFNYDGTVIDFYKKDAEKILGSSVKVHK